MASKCNQYSTGGSLPTVKDLRILPINRVISPEFKKQLDKYHYVTTNFSPNSIPCPLTFGGQRKNLAAELFAIEEVRPKVVFYSGAAPGFHISVLACRFPNVKFYLHDNNVGVFKPNKTIFSLSNVQIVNDGNIPTNADLWIDDNIEAQFNPALCNCKKIFRKLDVSNNSRIKGDRCIVTKDAILFNPPHRKQNSMELKVLYTAGSEKLPNDLCPSYGYLAKISIVYGILNKMRPKTGTCFECAAQCNLTTVEKHLLGKHNYVFPNIPENFKTALAQSLGVPLSELTFEDNKVDHPIIKAFRKAAKIVVCKEVAGSKVIEAGGRHSDYIQNYGLHVGWHVAQPTITTYDKEFPAIPEIGVTTCSHKVEDCNCKQDADVVVLQDVYLDMGAVEKLLSQGRDIVWSFNSLPTGKYPRLHTVIERENGLLKVKTTDSVDKSYTDPDPNYILDGLDSYGFKYEIVAKNGLYNVVRVYANQSVVTPQPNKDATDRIILKEVGGLWHLVLPHEVEWVQSQKALKSNVDIRVISSRVMEEFKVDQPTAFSIATVAMEQASSNLADFLPAVHSIVNEMKSSEFVMSDNFIMRSINTIGEVLKGSNNPLWGIFHDTILVPMRFYQQKGLSALQGGVNWLHKFAKRQRNKSGEASFLRLFWEVVLLVTRTLCGWLKISLDIEPGVVLADKPMPERCLNYKEFNDVFQDLSIPSERNQMTQTLPKVADIERPVILDARDIKNVRAVCHKRLGHEAKEPTEEAMEQLESEMDKLAEEIILENDGSKIHPMDFQSGRLDSQSLSALNCKLSGMNLTEPEEAKIKPVEGSGTGDYDNQSSSVSMAFSKMSLSVMENAAILLAAVTCTIGQYLGDTSRHSKRSYTKFPSSRRLLAIAIIPVSYCRSFMNKVTGFWKQTTRPGMHTSVCQFCGRLTNYIGKFSRFLSMRLVSSKCALRRIIDHVGSSVRSAHTTWKEPEYPATSIPPLATQSFTLRSTAQLPISVVHALPRSSKAMTPSSSDEDQELMSDYIETLDLKLSLSTVKARVKLSSAALLFYRCYRMGNWLTKLPGCLTRFFGTSPTCTPLTDTNANLTPQEIKHYVKLFATMVCPYWGGLPVTCGRLLETPEGSERKTVICFDGSSIMERLALQFVGKDVEYLLKNSALRLTSNLDASSISLDCNLGRILDIQYYLA
jgi:hypothetical protein